MQRTRMNEHDKIYYKEKGENKRSIGIIAFHWHHVPCLSDALRSANASKANRICFFVKHKQRCHE